MCGREKHFSHFALFLFNVVYSGYVTVPELASNITKTGMC